MTQDSTSTKIVSAPRLDGKMVKYITTLSVVVVNESQYQITNFSTQEIDGDKVYPENVHRLESEKLIFTPNDVIHRFMQKEKNIRPIRIGSLDVYPVLYEIKPGFTIDINIPCDLIFDAINKIDPQQEFKKETRGRRKKYTNPEERKIVQQKHALLHHYRKEALKNYLKSNPNDDYITVKVKVESKVLGSVNEEITYKRLSDGSYRKLQ